MENVHLVLATLSLCLPPTLPAQNDNRFDLAVGAFPGHRAAQLRRLMGRLLHAG